MIISKIKYSYNDMNKFNDNGVLQPAGNAYYYMQKFYNSSDNNRISKNPHDISFTKMYNSFGSPNFQDDYKEANWWILEYDNKKFAVATHDTEGSTVYQFLNGPTKSYAYDKQFSIDIENFCNQLFIQI